MEAKLQFGNFSFAICRTRINILLTLVILLLALFEPFVWAQDQTSSLTKQPSVAVGDGTADSGKQSTPLKGNVETIDLSLEKLREVESDLKRISKAAGALYDQAMIQPMRILTQPEVVGFGTVINLPVGTEPTGPPQPIQKQQIMRAIKNIKPIIDLMKKNVDDFVEDRKQLDLSDQVQQKLEPRFKEWIEMVNTVTLHENQLEQAAQMPPYDNRTIAALSSLIKDDIKELEKTRSAIYKVVRKENRG